MLGNHNTSRAKVVLIDCPQVHYLGDGEGLGYHTLSVYQNDKLEPVKAEVQEAMNGAVRSYVHSFFPDEDDKIEGLSTRTGRDRFLGFWSPLYGFWNFRKEKGWQPYSFFMNNNQIKYQTPITDHKPFNENKELRGTHVLFPKVAIWAD